MSGEPDRVAEAKVKIGEYLEEEGLNNHLLELKVPSAAYPLVLGIKGAAAREIQSKTIILVPVAVGVRLDLDRGRSTVVLRGR